MNYEPGPQNTPAGRIFYVEGPDPFRVDLVEFRGTKDYVYRLFNGGESHFGMARTADGTLNTNLVDNANDPGRAVVYEGVSG